ncbi:unnamed protein product [Plutella xylostella]|uniref:(diamondback moth) hypothetical protein n=1 Tax=Plutella xylostella TaxID=51655 RepID=A0A8S4DBP9_PLUXY|nr:unnamed protein product [Plutella xylostella]
MCVPPSRPPCSRRPVRVNKQSSSSTRPERDGAPRERDAPHNSPATLQLVGEIRSPHRFVDNCWKTFDFQIRISGASDVRLSVGCEDELCVLPAGRGATPRSP